MLKVIFRALRIELTQIQSKVEHSWQVGGLTPWEGGGQPNKVLYREAPPRGPTPYPVLYCFLKKRYPFRLPSIDKWYPFHTARL